MARLGRRGAAFRQRLRSAAGLVCLAAVSAGVVALTTAVLTDSTSVPSNSVATGSISLSATPSTAALTFTGMMPGDAQARSITITNNQAESRYALTATTSEAVLSAQMRLAVLPPSEVCTTSNINDPNALYTNILGTTSGWNVLGNPRQGPDPGDRILPANGGSETLCFIASLPTTATSTVAGKTTTLTLTAYAEQTANNTTPVMWPDQVAPAPDTLASTTPSTFITPARNYWNDVTILGNRLYIATDDGLATANLDGSNYQLLETTVSTTRLVVARGHLYSAEWYNQPNASTSGQIYEFNPTTGAPTLRIDLHRRVNYLASDGTGLYVNTVAAQGGSEDVHKVNVTVDGSLSDGGTLVDITPSDLTYDFDILPILVATNRHIYTPDLGGNLLDINLNNGQKTVLGTYPAYHPIVSLEGGTTSLYYGQVATHAALYRLPLTGGTPTLIRDFGSSTGAPDGLTTDGHSLIAMLYQQSGQTGGSFRFS